MHCWIGIDPGLKGAVAIIDSKGGIELFDAPTVTVPKKPKGSKTLYVLPDMLKILRPFAPQARDADAEDLIVHAMLEDVNPMPGEGVVSSFKFGRGLGYWEMALAALGIPYSMVRPVTWKKKLMSDMGKEKANSCVRASQLYPEATEVLSKNWRGKTIYLDGRGDALLLAHYAKSIGGKHE